MALAADQPLAAIEAPFLPQGFAKTAAAANANLLPFDATIAGVAPPANDAVNHDGDINFGDHLDGDEHNNEGSEDGHDDTDSSDTEYDDNTDEYDDVDEDSSQNSTDDDDSEGDDDRSGGDGDSQAESGFR